MPDILVSIDLGTTFTGVAWMTPRTPIQVINDWPGSGDRGERKVPTVLLFNDSNNALSSWGFECDDEDDAGKTRREYFKIFLDQDTLDAAHRQNLQSAARSVEEAQQLVTHYLRQVYIHVKDTIESQIGRRHTGGWGDMSVEFIFSVPTTWTSMDIINRFKTIIRNAGFGAEGPRHNAVVDLTEAEAAAVATVKTSAVVFHKDDIFLCIDAGGGTSDLALMQVTSMDEKVPSLKQIDAVKGIGIGAALIDRAFAALVTAKLSAFPEVKAQLPPDYPARMARSHAFKTIKHKFGQKAYSQPRTKIHMEGVSHDFSHAGLSIEQGRMVFTEQELQSLFDPQIRGIIRLVTEQLDWLRENGRSDQVHHIVLSGGLGSSPYIRDQLQQQFMNFPHPNASRVAILPCQDPQLVVVRGLLLDRQQKMETGGTASVLSARIARASYGVVVQEVYTPAKHFNEDVVVDPYDKKQKWATNQIEWLIKKGDVITPGSPLVKAMQIRLASNDTTRAWTSHFIVSHNEPSFLPCSLKHAGAIKLCDVKSNLTGVQQHQLVMKNKRGTCFSNGYTFYMCAFDIKVIVAPADLRFELWFGGEKFSGNHEPVTVTWDPVGARSHG
ncbi:hypothetical protein BX600DRAFT_415644 [Xylariales sp. PMI_506]|nr:hypothetical protein BX600DRAFT_415644 [Xylariales sp. PMI_506]